jgi:methylphosphotriester-DNA--protein-cysteine methyltransferase
MKQELLEVERVNLDECRALARKGVHFVASDTTGVFCYPSCAHARRITPPHRVGFTSTAGALGAGYRPCRHCRPAPVTA